MRAWLLSSDKVRICIWQGLPQVPAEETFALSVRAGSVGGLCLHSLSACGLCIVAYAGCARPKGRHQPFPTRSHHLQADGHIGLCGCTILGPPACEAVGLCITRQKMVPYKACCLHCP